MLKVKMVSWVVVMALGIFAADFFFRNPAMNTNGRDENTVTLVVKFGPRRRVADAAAVGIQVLVAGRRVISESSVRSPWERTVQVGSGRELTLLASMAYGQSLECHIRVGKGSVFSNWRDNPGQVMCSHKF